MKSKTIINRTGLTDTQIRLIHNTLKENPKVESIKLFGSRAMGKYNKSSDIDLALNAAGLTVSELLRLKEQLDDLLFPFMIDIVVYEEIENKDLREHIDRNGIHLSELLAKFA